MYEEEGYGLLPAGEEEWAEQMAGLHEPGTCWDSLSHGLVDAPDTCPEAGGGRPTKRRKKEQVAPAGQGERAPAPPVALPLRVDHQSVRLNL